MGTLTKICVVVLVGLVLLACPIFIQQAVTPGNWKKAFEAEQAARKLADAKTRHEEMVADVWRQEADGQKRAAENVAERFRKDTDAKLARIGDLQRQIDDKQRTIDGLTANETELQNALKQALALNGVQSRELKTHRDADIALNDQLRKAHADIEKHLLELGLLTRARQVLEEQVAQKDDELRDLRAQLKRLQETGVATVAVRPQAKLPKIEGTVTAVSKDIASLNVGSVDGVKKGMQFILYREDQFVAHLQVELVNASACSGILVDSQLDAKQGDKATTSLEEE